MEIRLLKSSDAKEYWELRLEALQQNPEAFATSYEEAIKRENPIGGIANNFNQKNNFTFGAFEQGELIGMVTLLQETQAKLKHKANIFAMYVSPSKRCLGIGKALLSGAINKANDIEEVEKVNLTVAVNNERAKRLYIKLGFKTFGIEEKALKINDVYINEEYMNLFVR